MKLSNESVASNILQFLYYVNMEMEVCSYESSWAFSPFNRHLGLQIVFDSKLIVKIVTSQLEVYVRRPDTSFNVDYSNNIW